MGILDCSHYTYKASVASNISYKLKFKCLFKEVRSMVVLNLKVRNLCTVSTEIVCIFKNMAVVFLQVATYII